MSTEAATDPFAELKARQRRMWTTFAPMATFSTPVAAHLVRYAQVQPGESVLDVGTGTGVVAITAARAGARASGLDLTPELLEEARRHAAVAGLGDIEFVEGDAEALPYPDRSFDLVLSQFGHMFAPRPAVAIAEMTRVLKPGGRIAFATWPPEHFTGRMFAFVGRHSPPPPPGAAPPPQWGDPRLIAERLGAAYETPEFARGVMRVPSLSVPHMRLLLEEAVGPLRKLIESAQSDATRLATLRGELEALLAPYHHDNLMHQDYLLTRANLAA